MLSLVSIDASPPMFEGNDVTVGWVREGGGGGKEISQSEGLQVLISSTNSNS